MAGNMIGQPQPTFPTPHTSEADMNFTKNIGMLLLAIWLILSGAFALFGIVFSHEAIVMGVLALVAGVFVLIGR